MYRRNILIELEKWAKREDRKPLVLRGARQVGKTTLVNMFAGNFQHYIYLNLELKDDRKPFEDFTTIDVLVQTLFLQKNISVSNKENTLLFIDEIQELPEALQILRYFYELEPSIPVIAAGSLLETIFNTEISFPVGRVEYIVVRPVSFDEFLLAIGEREALTQLQTVPFNDFAYDKLLSLFHTYTLIGGMPEVVKQYAATKDVTGLSGIYNSLLTSYSDDVEKYAKSQAQILQIRHVIQTMYAEAGKRIKFEGFGKSNYGSREMGEALRTLEKAMLLHLIYPNTGASLPLLPDKRKSPKLQLLDTGLLNFSLGIQKDIIGTKDLHAVYNGTIIEHMAGQEILATQYSSLQALHFWVREKKTSMAEVDYLFAFDAKLIPVEIKAGTEGKLKSLHQYMDMAPHNLAIRFCAARPGISTITTAAGKKYFLLTLPYFLVSQIHNNLLWFKNKILVK